MIFKLDNSIITEDERLCHVFAHALQRAHERMHYVVMDYPVQKWLEDKLMSGSTYLGDLDRNEIWEDQFFMNPTALENRTLRTVVVGQGDGLLSIDEMYCLVEEPGVVVLENGLNDWSALTAWADMLANKRCLNQSINDSVLSAIRHGLLRKENAGGGSGTIRNAIISIMPQYEGLHSLRVTTIFDSDKISQSDSEDHNFSLKQFLTNEKIEWHELSRREIENYFPIEVFERAGLLVRGVDISVADINNWAYVDVEHVIGVNYTKKDLPLLSKNLQRQDLLSLGEGVEEEIQEIILHLAKYI